MLRLVTATIGKQFYIGDNTYLLKKFNYSNPNNPVPLSIEWKPTTSGKNMEYLEIGQELAMKADLASRARLWAELPLWHNVRKRIFNDEL